jgi:hypothetical protein
MGCENLRGEGREGERYCSTITKTRHAHLYTILIYNANVNYIHVVIYCTVTG